ncbi:hypothetical protein AB1Y20_012870 [Prymnesium parvum]|uniref:Uncharacterized protein n=1 Tax=Prymnesium parvum TaxID=97485 RepID=A0AB34IMP2_PRYPA
MAATRLPPRRDESVFMRSLRPPTGKPSSSCRGMKPRGSSARSLAALVLLLSVHSCVCSSRLEAWTHKLQRQQEQMWRSVTRRTGATRVPTGAVYSCTVHLPIVGEQSFVLRIDSHRLARIILKGRLSLDEPAEFQVGSQAEHAQHVQVLISFNQATVDLLARWKTKIRAVLYHPEDDYTVLVIAPPLIPAIRVKMERVRSHRDNV